MPVFSAIELFDSATGHCKRIASLADPYIQVDMQILALAKHLEPFCQGSFTISFGTDKDTAAERVSRSRHPLAENRHSSEFTAAISLLEIAVPAQALNTGSAMTGGGAINALLNDEYFLFLQIIQDCWVMK